jgi:hypothetical protein|tara:strand:- start:180 stop:695 length:516 start_codon:yes stop_codon:yes gene_type:complete
MSILKSEINLQGTKPSYPRSTRNFYQHTINGLTLYFSYQTLIAIDNLISVNNWSVSTARHLYWINPNKDIRVNDFDEQARKILQNNDLLDTSDPFKTVATISTLFELMSNDETEEDIRKTNNQRMRFYETQGVERPKDWDTLTVADQKKRLDMCDYQNLEGEGAKEYMSTK